MKKCLNCHWGYKEEDVKNLPCFRGEPDCFHGGPSMWAPLTNGDRIRQMDDLELAAQLFAYSSQPRIDMQRILEWIKEEAKDDRT